MRAISATRASPATGCTSLAVLPRRELDHVIQRAALRAGARWQVAKFEAPMVTMTMKVNIS